jgi:thiol-disulfide isomerase/thioredoxin
LAEGCPHCEEEIPFLQELAVKFPQVTINGFEVGSHSGNREYFYALGDAMGSIPAVCGHGDRRSILDWL